LETLKQDIVDANAKEEGDDEAVEMLRDTLKKSREKYCKDGGERDGIKGQLKALNVVLVLL